MSLISCCFSIFQPHYAADQGERRHRGPVPTLLMADFGRPISFENGAVEVPVLGHVQDDAVRARHRHSAEDRALKRIFHLAWPLSPHDRGRERGEDAKRSETGGEMRVACPCLASSLSSGDLPAPNNSRSRFEFRKHVAYDAERRRLVHIHARRELRTFADAFGLAPDAYDLRSNEGGIAVSGEVTLHTERLYVQACQVATGVDTGIFFQFCAGRRDYVGNVNNFASLGLLRRPAELARRIRLTGVA